VLIRTLSFLEKIKPGSERVNILEIGLNDNNYPDITGDISPNPINYRGDLSVHMSSYNAANDVFFIHDILSLQP
jgi:hypothetical protein